MLAVSAPVVCEPLADLEPDQAPEAVHAVALVDDQLKVEPLPLATVLGLAVKLTVGAGAVTVTVADCVALPQDLRRREGTLNWPRECHSTATHSWACCPTTRRMPCIRWRIVADHANIDALPLLIAAGVAESAHAGADIVTETVVDCVALPPAPVQVSKYVALAVNAPVDCDPLNDLLPDQAPDAVHEVALLDVQDKVELAPLAIVVGVALMLTVAVCFGLTLTIADCAALPPALVQVNV